MESSRCVPGSAAPVCVPSLRVADLGRAWQGSVAPISPAEELRLTGSLFRFVQSTKSCVRNGTARFLEAVADICVQKFLLGVWPIPEPWLKHPNKKDCMYD